MIDKSIVKYRNIVPFGMKMGYGWGYDKLLKTTIKKAIEYYFGYLNKCLSVSRNMTMQALI